MNNLKYTNNHLFSNLYAKDFHVYILYTFLMSFSQYLIFLGKKIEVQKIII
jgi:hypothetical protein